MEKGILWKFEEVKMEKNKQTFFGRSSEGVAEILHKRNIERYEASPIGY